MAAVDAAVSRIAQHCRAAAKAGLHFVKPASELERDVIFIAGQQRSGTNMMMDVLDRHWSTDVFHETDHRAFDNYQMRDLTVIHQLYKTSRARHFVIKALCELQNLRQMLDAFPQARAVWLIRNYQDVCHSMVRQFSSTADVLKMMRTDLLLGGWRGQRMSSATYGHLLELVGDDVTEASASAFQWYMRNILFFEQGLDQDQRVKLVAYEDLVTETGQTFDEVFDFLGIEFQESATRHIFSTSIGKVDHLTINPSIADLCCSLSDRFAAVIQTKH